jgi:hypothetical protein
MDELPQEEPVLPANQASRQSNFYAACAIGTFTTLSTILLVTPFSTLLTLLFPALGLLCGLFVYSKSKPRFVSFVLWIWFLTPFVHRVVDVRAGPEQAILLTPYLVASVAGIFLLRNLQVIAQPDMLPFSCALSAIVYGLVIGSFRYDPIIVGTVLSEWLVPVLFGFFLYAYPAEREAIAKSFKNTFGLAVILTGAYGIYQFVAAPSWDMNWLQSNLEEFVSIGKPEAMQFRSFSTMNSPPVFGVAMMTGLLLLTAFNKKMRIPAAMFGFVAMLLTSSRSAWVGFLGGVIILFSFGSKRQRVRIAAQIVGFALLLLVTLQIPILGTFVSDRFRNFNDMRDDASVGDRIQGYKEAVGSVLHEPFGEGLGSANVLHTGEVIGPHDSSFLESFYSLGWLGTLVYGSGLIFACIRIFRTTDRSHSEDIRVGRAVVAAFLIQSPLNSIMLGQAGFFLWTIAALSLKEMREQQPAYEQSPRLAEPDTRWLGAWNSKSTFSLGFDRSKDPLGP